MMQLPVVTLFLAVASLSPHVHGYAIAAVNREAEITIPDLATKQDVSIEAPLTGDEPPTGLADPSRRLIRDVLTGSDEKVTTSKDGTKQTKETKAVSTVDTSKKDFKKLEKTSKITTAEKTLQYEPQNDGKPHDSQLNPPKSGQTSSSMTKKTPKVGVVYLKTKTINKSKAKSVNEGVTANSNENVSVTPSVGVVYVTRISNKKIQTASNNKKI